MRTIGVVTCALVIASTLDMPTSAQVLDFVTIDIPGASSTADLAQGINPRGDIVGTYSVGGITHGFLAR